MQSSLSLQPRQYQISAADIAISKNSIINIRTGGGKTLIAVLVINHFLSLTNVKNILFIVPSRALVSQQAQYFRDNCSIKIGSSYIYIYIIFFNSFIIIFHVNIYIYYRFRFISFRNVW